MSKLKFAQCSCFLSHNYFVTKYKLHTLFLDREQFWDDYGATLGNMGCVDEEAKEEVMSELLAEKRRREGLQEESRRRRQVIQKNYVPRNGDLYQLQDRFLDPKFLAIVEGSRNVFRQNKSLSSLFPLLEVIKREERLYSFPVFTQKFCSDLMDELEYFEASDMPKGRPNTMNNCGILLNEMGFDESFFTPFREKYMNIVAKVLFGDWGGGDLDSHKVFTVSYKPGGDRSLSLHFDNSEVTLNVCLGKDFEGGELYFTDEKTATGPTETPSIVPVVHRTGQGILHCGRQLHGALPVTEGIRNNIILWMRASRVRNSLCPMCASVPNLIGVQGFGDGFTLKPSS